MFFSTGILEFFKEYNIRRCLERIYAGFFFLIAISFLLRLRRLLGNRKARQINYQPIYYRNVTHVEMVRTTRTQKNYYKLEKKQHTRVISKTLHHSFSWSGSKKLLLFKIYQKPIRQTCIMKFFTNGLYSDKTFF